MSKTFLRLGGVSLNPRGAYDPKAAYERLDLVYYENDGYIALRHSEGVTPEDGADWMRLVSSGSAVLAQSYAEGGTGTREGEDTDNAKYYAKLAQSIAQGCQGYYVTDALLKEKVPKGQDGQWAIVGTTDTIWIWDSDTSAWVDSGKKTDLSQYYTKTETDAALAKKQNLLTFDDAPTANSANPVKSGGVHSALAGKLGVNDKAKSAGTADKVANALTFTGGSTDVYDGSKAVSVKIPSVPAEIGALPADGKAASAAKADTATKSTATDQIKWGTAVPTTANISDGQIYLKYT